MANSSIIGIKITGDGSALEKALADAGNQVDSFGAKVKNTKDPLESLAQGLRIAFLGSSAVVGLIGIKNQLGDFTQSMVRAQIQVDQLRNGLNFAVGRDNAAGELNFLRGTAQELGLEFVTTAQQYTKLAAAARGTALEGQQTRDIFTAIAQASTVMGLSVEQTQGALMAITQMISKGNVQSEELRGQLGERLPGAFQTAARAMGVTTAELGKLLETGQVTATDFLPKFARQLSQEVGPEVVAASQAMQASINHLGNAWTTLKQVTAQSGVSKVVANEAQGMANYLQGLSDHMDRVAQSGGGMAHQLLAGLGFVIARAPFDVLSESANILNRTINFMTGGVLTLRTNLNLLPQAFDTNAQRADKLGEKLDAARHLLAKLQAEAERKPGALYVRFYIQDTIDYIKTLEQAIDKQNQLTGNARVNPGILAQGMARTAYENQRLADQATLAKLRQKFSGQSPDYQADLSALAGLRERGAFGSEKEYVGVITDLINTKGGVKKPEKPADTSREIARAQLAGDLADYKNYAAQLTHTYSNAQKIVEAMRAAGLTQDSNYYASRKQFLELDARAQEDALTRQIERLQREKFSGKHDAKDRIDNQKNIADATARLAQVRADAATERSLLSINSQVSATKAAQYFRDSEDAAQSYLDTLRRDNARELAGVGVGDQGRNRAAARGQIEDRYDHQRSTLEKSRRDAELSGTFGPDAQAKYDNELARIQRFQAQALTQWDQHYEQRQALERNWSRGATEALVNYYDQSQKTGAQVNALLTNSFKGMEDALVGFATTGKLSFTSLADSIIADITRIMVRQSITGPLAKSIKEGMDSGTGAGGFIGSLFGKLFGKLLPFANGGRPPTGTPYLVGENGPELRIDDRPGTIVPNAALLSGGAQAVTVNVYPQSGQTATVQQRQTESGTTIDVLLRQVEDALGDNVGAGAGALARALENRYGLATMVR